MQSTHDVLYFIRTRKENEQEIQSPSNHNSIQKISSSSFARRTNDKKICGGVSLFRMTSLQHCKQLPSLFTSSRSPGGCQCNLTRSSRSNLCILQSKKKGGAVLVSTCYDDWFVIHQTQSSVFLIRIKGGPFSLPSTSIVK